VVAIGDFKIRTDDNGSPGSDEGGTAINDRETGETGEQGNGGSSFLDDVATAGSGTVIEDEPIPRKTLPPPSVVVKRGRKPGSKNKNATKNHGISSESCEAFLATVYAGASLALTGNLGLALESDLATTSSSDNRTEGSKLGESLAKCLDTIPDNPATRLIAASSVWLEFLANVAGTVIKRYFMVMMYQQQQQMQQPRPSPTRPEPPPDQEIYNAQPEDYGETAPARQDVDADKIRNKFGIT
jgi:hypothetical protein